MSRLSTSFDLLGLAELERYKFVYAVLALFLYLFTITICCLIVYVVWAEETLHEPMYVFISNLVINGIYGSSVVLPKIIVSLLSGSRTTWFLECLIQAFGIHSFAAVELFTFTVMAQDRYLAIGQPLRYPIFMNNDKAIKHIISSWVVAFIVVLIPVTMSAFLHMCGVNINNVFCDNTSFIMLACGGASVNNIFGAVEAFSINIICLLVIIYYYIRTFVICLKFSREAYQKAVRTLVTHLTAFSTVIISSFFVLLRYRINGGSISLAAHVVISVFGAVTPTTLNPLIYGFRTEALKLKIIRRLKKTTGRGNVLTS
ncbi:PREDICTED: olfactory receptor 4D5-like [Nanorana parkeri]|uniref:olfactory receptor 4D5-like n=1 Tax=Nanorana parkeri TaxID=125878 RepID=UPI000854F9D6|nr:PREDICTED: olfactory receptor 4D5-like [Nanorana parkeri]